MRNELSDTKEEKELYCPYCGVKVAEEHRFCCKCGKELPTLRCNDTQSSPLKPNQVNIPVTVSTPMVEEITPAKTPTKSSKKKGIGVFVLITICIVLVIVGINLYKPYAEQKKIEQQEQAEREHTLDVLRALREYSYHPYGMNDADYNTVHYSQALGYVADAALGDASDSSLKDKSKDEKKEYAFDMLERYVEHDYSKFYATLIFGADYFDSDEITRFFNGTKLSSAELKEHAEDIMCRDAISLSSLLVNEADQVICLNICSRVNFAQQGYMSANELVSELYDFVFWGSGITTIDEDLLLENVSWKYVEANRDEFFSGSKVYYKDLSPVGKMVFLYVIPYYISTFDQNAANELWNDYSGQYESWWNEIINRDIFSMVLY